jgi:hypothetical protein
LGVIVFARLLPIVPLWDVKEGQILATRIELGRADVPAAIRD